MAVVGEEAIFYAAFFNFFFQPLAFTIGPYLIEKEHHEFSFKHFLNPAIIATLVGLVIFILQIELPVFINTPLDMVAEITNPLSMIVIGASLANVNFKKIFGNWQLYAYSIIRLFVIPMVVFFTLNAITDQTLLIVIPSIVSGMPAPATAVIVSKIFGTEVDVLNASEGVFMSTVLSMISIPVIAAIIMMNI
jgi:predicted permease